MFILIIPLLETAIAFGKSGGVEWNGPHRCPDLWWNLNELALDSERASARRKSRHFNGSGEACVAVECRFIEHILGKYRQRMYHVCMKKRINMYLEEEDRSMVRFLQAKYGLDTESNTIRFLIRKAAKAEGYIQTKQERRKE